MKRNKRMVSNIVLLKNPEEKQRGEATNALLNTIPPLPAVKVKNREEATNALFMKSSSSLQSEQNGKNTTGERGSTHEQSLDVLFAAFLGRPSGKRWRWCSLQLGHVLESFDRVRRLLLFDTSKHHGGGYFGSTRTNR